MKRVLFIIGLLMVSGPTFSQTLQRSQLNVVATDAQGGNFSGLRAFKPVLDRVLYRGGGPGGKVSLRTNQLQALCQNGFSSAGYLYPDNFNSPTQVNCGAQNLEYRVVGFRAAGAEQTLRAIYNIIKSQSTANPQGPMFLHCWNGWHASGEISAYALRQFCNMSGDEAARYWAQNIGDQGNLSKYGSIQNRIRNFNKISSLEITDAERARICPQ